MGTAPRRGDGMVAMGTSASVADPGGSMSDPDPLRILLVAYNTWMCIALFNPLLQSIGTSAALFAIYGMLMLAAVPAWPTIARA